MNASFNVLVNFFQQLFTLLDSVMFMGNFVLCCSYFLHHHRRSFQHIFFYLQKFYFSIRCVVVVLIVVVGRFVHRMFGPLLDLMNEVEFVPWIKCLIEMSNKTIETDCHVENRLLGYPGYLLLKLNHLLKTKND